MISDGDKCTDQPMHPGCWVGWCLPTVQNCGTSMEVGLCGMCAIVSEAGWPGLH